MSLDEYRLRHLCLCISKSSCGDPMTDTHRGVNRRSLYRFLYFRCFSSVGDQQTGQILSLGPGCDHKAVIEHELLHAVGFYHEQSRTDRDDYVDIWLDQVLPGINFLKSFCIFCGFFGKNYNTVCLVIFNHCDDNVGTPLWQDLGTTSINTMTTSSQTKTHRTTTSPSCTTGHSLSTRMTPFPQ